MSKTTRLLLTIAVVCGFLLVGFAMALLQHFAFQYTVGKVLFSAIVLGFFFWMVYRMVGQMKESNHG